MSLSEPVLDVFDRYHSDEDRIHHLMRLNHIIYESWIQSKSNIFHNNSDKGGQSESDLKGAWWRAYLDGITPVPVTRLTRSFRLVDLFAGAGGLALGIRRFLAETGSHALTELAADTDARALTAYAANHNTRICSTDSVGSLVDFRLRGWADDADFVYEPEMTDDQISEATKGVDLVMAGPPCQGHSNLNNWSRRDDTRNLLYLTVPAFAVAAGAKAIIIENVPSVIHDQTCVVQTTRRLLELSGYEVTEGVLAADAMGWPQTRRRFFMVARRDGPPIPLEQVTDLLTEHDHEPRSVWWAIGDDQAVTGHPTMDAASDLTTENRERINWLFDNDAYDLDLERRPTCHQDGTTYTSVYGRMHRDKPSGTITTGFMTPGRGRFVHPTERRTLTPGEAARLQGFPKNYRFVTDPNNPPSRAQLAKWIGDAVPMPLGYGAALAALGPSLGASGH